MAIKISKRPGFECLFWAFTCVIKLSYLSLIKSVKRETKKGLDRLKVGNLVKGRKEYLPVPAVESLPGNFTFVVYLGIGVIVVVVC